MVGLLTRAYIDGNGAAQLVEANFNGTADEIVHTFNGAVIVSGNFTRPANTTAYASGEVVANSVTAGSVTPISLTVGRLSAGPGEVGMIRRARLKKSTTGTTGAQFRIHFFNSSPTTSAGDGASITTAITGIAKWIGAIDVDMSTYPVFADGAVGEGAPNEGFEINFTTQTVFALIEARGAYTPGSGETITLEVEALQN